MMSAVFTAVRRKLSVDAYHDLAKAGHLTEDDRVELIEGEIIEMAPIGGPHMNIVNRLNRFFVMALGDRAIVSPQNPVTLPRYSEPQPDLAILNPAIDRDLTKVPEASDVLLLVEVADTTLAYDRGTKLPLYARHGISEVWIVDVQRKRIEAYREPGAEGYARKIEISANESIAMQALPDVRLELSRLFSG